MRLLAFTDIHSAFSVVENILREEQTADVVLLGGDLTTRGSSEDVRRVIAMVQQYTPRVFAIGGNMDPLALETTMRDLDVSLDGRGCVIGDVGFFGISGAPLSPLRTPHEFPEANLEMTGLRGWEEMKKARVRVLLSHAPPVQTSLDRIRSGKHVGSSAVRMIIERLAPDLVVCGHIHESFGVTSMGDTLVVNCGCAAEGRYASLEIGNGIIVDLRLAARKG
jgi:uncharacterized protein